MPSNIARDFIVEGHDSATGAAFLDEKIPSVVGHSPSESQDHARQILESFYIYFGHFDRQFEIILEADFDESTWTYADEMMLNGNVARFGGFTVHPKYLKAAESFVLFELWEQRGPPDFCKKLDGDWVCE